jgi:hypothetical protein
MVAGYMLVTKPSFRSLMFVPDKVKQSQTFFRKDSYDMMEVNGLWIGPGVKSPSSQFKIWMHLLKDVLLCRKKYLLLMSDINNKTIRRIHDMTAPCNLYEGESFSFAGEQTHRKIRVAYTTRSRALMNLPKYLIELNSRKVRAKQYENRKALIGAQITE